MMCPDCPAWGQTTGKAVCCLGDALHLDEAKFEIERRQAFVKEYRKQSQLHEHRHTRLARERAERAVK